MDSPSLCAYVHMGVWVQQPEWDLRSQELYVHSTSHSGKRGAVWQYVTTSQYKAGQPVRRATGLGARYRSSRKSEQDAGDTKRSELCLPEAPRGPGQPLKTA